ncbi:MAG: hypothetical protein WD314_12195 [Trueperaceae bacterium]
MAQNNDVVYFEAVPSSEGQVSGAIEVTAYNVSGSTATAILRSTTSSWFGLPNDPGLAGLGLGDDFAASGIGNNAPRCGGPCVVVPTPASAGSAYIRVRALENTDFDLYVVATDYFDTGEPNNGTSSEAVTVTPDTDGFLTDSGTIETVGDKDWYVPDRDVGQVSFVAATSGNPVALVARIYTEDGSFDDSIGPGETYVLPFNEPLQRFKVEVRSSESRAAGAGTAAYTLTFE